MMNSINMLKVSNYNINDAVNNFTEYIYSIADNEIYP
jgi:hypothetical protein